MIIKSVDIAYNNNIIIIIIATIKGSASVLNSLVGYILLLIA